MKRGLITFATAAATFVFTLTVRVDSIGTRFWLLRDQIRDWSIALGPFTDLPLVGPATHVGGYTIGPAFYWILWGIRVTVGPFFQNLPHAGGIGQAALQSAADALLLVAIWRRTRSLWIAATAIVLIATASFDLALAALVWNPTMGSTLARVAMALVLLDWYRGSVARVALTTLVAWSAVHAYTGAIFMTVGVFVAMLSDPWARREWLTLRRTALTIAAAVALLQVPYLAHQLLHQFRDSAMGAVVGSVGQVLSGSARPEFGKSLIGYAAAFHFIQISPWHVPFVSSSWQVPFAGGALLACGGILALHYRRDPSLLAVTLLPQLLAVIGYALFLDDLDHYYYLSLMPAAVLTVALAVTAVPSPVLARTLSIVMMIGVFALVPARLHFAATLHRMPEYGVLVDASRKIRSLRQPMRAIRTGFTLPPTSDPEFLYTVLGGKIDRSSPWVATIMSDGRILYQNVSGS